MILSAGTPSASISSLAENSWSSCRGKIMKMAVPRIGITAYPSPFMSMNRKFWSL